MSEEIDNSKPEMPVPEKPVPEKPVPEKPMEEEPRVHHRFWARLKTYFLTGLVVAVPIGVTIYLAWSFVTFVDDKVLPLVPKGPWRDALTAYDIPGLGLVILILALTVLGALAANLFGNALIVLGERIVARMPVVRTIYTGLKQIMQTVVAQGDDTFQDVCLFEYPRRGIWAIGFVTTHTRGEISRTGGEEMVSVFLPTTPNPTSGYLLFIPKTDAHILNMTVEEGAKLVISAGLVVPEEVSAPEETGDSDSAARRFLKKAEKAIGGR